LLPLLPLLPLLMMKDGTGSKASEAPPGCVQGELASIHRYIASETTVSQMPFWQLLPRVDQLECCKKIKLCKGPRCVYRLLHNILC
jgi:hypothetical protein